MSRYMSKNLEAMTPYTPGEQPRDQQYVKLNTNESPFPPSAKAMEYMQEHMRALNLYPDPTAEELRRAVAMHCQALKEEVIMGNGSDELLYFAFRAFGDADHPIVSADITYGCYPVFAAALGLKYETVPLDEGFGIRPEDYDDKHGVIVIANPNAPTGRCLTMAEIDRLAGAHPDDVIIVDEAYIDFGGQSVLPLTKKYDNLLVVQTFSKSRSMAGARLGFAVGDKRLIADMETVRNSFNPYNINSMTMSLGLGALADRNYFLANCRTIIKNRDYTVTELMKLGFKVLDSKANFIFASHPSIGGKELYLSLKERGVLVRYFDKDRIREYVRISIGKKEQMDVLLEKVQEILAK